MIATLTDELSLDAAIRELATPERREALASRLWGIALGDVPGASVADQLAAADLILEHFEEPEEGDDDE